MKRIEVIIVSILVLISLTGFASAAICSPDQTILKISSATNGHAANYTDPNYNIDICYSQIFGSSYSGTNPHECSAGPTSNRVLSLYSNTNSHASVSPAGIDICYGNLVCQTSTGSCPTGTNLIASLSSVANAHIASDSSYPIKICCSNGGLSTITSANWTFPDNDRLMSYGSKNEYTNFSLNTSGISDGQKVHISVYNSSNNLLIYGPVTIDVINNRASNKTLISDMISNKVDVGGKIYFEATYLDNSGGIIAQVKSNELTIVNAGINLAQWKTLNNVVINRINLRDNVMMYGDTSGLSGKLANITVYRVGSSDIFVKSYKDIIIPANGQVQREINLTYESKYSESTSHKMVNGDKYFFILSTLDNSYLIKSATLTIRDDVITSGCCEYIDNEDDCNEAIPSSSSCIFYKVDPTCENPGYEINTRCEWDNTRINNKCIAREDLIETESGDNAGSCFTSYDNIDAECGQDGFRRISIKVTKTDSAICQANPLCLDPCEGGECKIPCRNVALLPFVTTTQVIFAVILILIGYAAIRHLSRRKKSNKQKA